MLDGYCDFEHSLPDRYCHFLLGGYKKNSGYHLNANLTVKTGNTPVLAAAAAASVAASVVAAQHHWATAESLMNWGTSRGNQRQNHGAIAIISLLHLVTARVTENHWAIAEALGIRMGTVRPKRRLMRQGRSLWGSCTGMNLTSLEAMEMKPWVGRLMNSWDENLRISLLMASI